MTDKELFDRLQKASHPDDPEADHAQQDTVVEEALLEMGFYRSVEYIRSRQRWFA